ncbi:MAG: caspase family protein [Bacteroidetes bacterium]|nr:caspase family protein [Bacteroidota bacterium]MDA1121190.1 caspase family protein [Bacteroidota bacterium]
MKAKLTLLSILLFTITITSYGQAVEGTTPAVSIKVGTQPAPVVADPVVNKAEEQSRVTLETLGITNLPKYHALIIGVSEYDNAGSEFPNLEMPAKDAEKLYELLTENYAFDKQNTTLLKNPTREQMINQFDRLIHEVDKTDNLLVFYAGHGYYDKRTDFGFWLPSDAKTTSRSDWIANSTIKDYIGAIKTKHTLLITDACFGGSIFKTRSVGTIMKRFNELYVVNSRKAITSGNLTEVPDNSIFLKYLLKSLGENQDVFLSSSQLFTRIYEPILNNSPSTPQFGVIQGAGDEGGDFVFISRKGQF